MNTKTPQCIGIIMDGNRRWAKGKGLPVIKGHEAGVETLKNIVRAAKDAGVGTLIFYAFSTENWNRAKDEVEALIMLFRRAVKKEFQEVADENVRIRFVGDLSRFDDDLRSEMMRIEKETEQHDGGTVAFAISYGGRAEILAAVNTAIKNGTHGGDLDEQAFSKLLWTHDLPDPDIIIRTGGEKRLSNFLTWSSVYSELFFTDTLWPDFSKEEFRAILDSYAKRERRHGT
jgi:undecaprenyl diphosphate synthase